MKFCPGTKYSHSTVCIRMQHYSNEFFLILQQPKSWLSLLHQLEQRASGFLYITNHIETYNQLYCVVILFSINLWLFSSLCIPSCNQLLRSVMCLASMYLFFFLQAWATHTEVLLVLHHGWIACLTCSFFHKKASIPANLNLQWGCSPSQAGQQRTVCFHSCFLYVSFSLTIVCFKLNVWSQLWFT